MEAILLQSEEVVTTISAFACPLCDEWTDTITARQEKQENKIRILSDGEMVHTYGTRKQFRRHLGRHMEQLALFALPRNDNGDRAEDEEKLEHSPGVALRSPLGGSGLAGPASKRAKWAFWFCCQCGDGPSSVEIILRCPECYHGRCDDCTLT